MAYLGNQPVVGDSANTFKLLDDISSFTLTFDGSSASVVSVANDTLTFANHRFITGQRVTYGKGGGTVITGLTDATAYFIIKVDQSTIKLATNASNAASSTAIDLTGLGAGTSHTLKVAFDGVNTKFKATHTSGIKSKISRAAQISLSINGVIQQPQDTSSPTVGYGIEPDSTIVFSTAPVATDKVFGSFIGEVSPSFDLTDNTVDNFTGDGSTTTFTLSREIPSSQDVLVTLDGVTQHPSDASTTRSYSVVNQGLSFTSAPANGVAIQARHIGFAGATTSEVTGFYGRTGNVALTSTDDISVSNVSAGIITATTFGGNPSFTGSVSIGGTLTYEDVTNIDSVGLITARNGIVVGSGITLSKDGDVFATGIITASQFKGSLTGATLVSTAGLTVTGTGLFADDVSIADKIVHTTDTNTAIRFPSADTITAETGGSERARIDSGGRLLLGLTSDSRTTSMVISGNTSGATSFGMLNIDIGTTSVSADTNIGIIRFGATGDRRGADIRGLGDGTWSAGSSHPTRLACYTCAASSTSPTERLRIDKSGNIQIGAGSVALPKATQGGVDIDSGAYTACIGGNVNSSGRTNSTDKISRITSPHYTNAEEPVMMFSAYNQTGNNFIQYGGGSSITNAATEHIFYTAANNTTTTGTERLRITSAGLVGIDINNPDVKLTVKGATVGSTANDQNDGLKLINYSTNINQLIFGTRRLSNGSDWTTTCERIQRRIDVTKMGYIDFGRASDGSKVVIGNESQGDVLEVENAGNITITNGDLVFAAGHGINFSQNANHAQANNELLDDYEEGTFTPRFKAGDNSGAASTTVNEAQYTKIGNLVYFRFYIALAAHASGTTAGSAFVIDLPFTNIAGHAAVSVGYWAGWAANQMFVTATVQPNAAHILFRHNTSVSTASATMNYANNLQVGSVVIVSGCYQTTAA